MIDYGIIVIYVLFLFLIVSLFNAGNLAFSPIRTQLIGFVSLTLPVFFYFFFSEKSRYRATVGKRLLNISVHADPKNIGSRILRRNVLKFLPWEIAHVGVNWAVFYSESGETTPVWVWITLIVPQTIVLGYLISVVVSKGRSSFYDRLADTVVEINQDK